MTHRRLGSKGFTMVELLTVLTIIAVLATIGITVYFNAINKARVIKTVSAMETFKKALEVYTLEHAGYPVSIDFVDFTDQDGMKIMDSSMESTVRSGVFSFDSYAAAPNDYTLVVKALDSRRTVVTVTPTRITY